MHSVNYNRYKLSKFEYYNPYDYNVCNDYKSVYRVACKINIYYNDIYKTNYKRTGVRMLGNK